MPVKGRAIPRQRICLGRVREDGLNVFPPNLVSKEAEEGRTRRRNGVYLKYENNQQKIGNRVRNKSKHEPRVVLKVSIKRNFEKI